MYGGPRGAGLEAWQRPQSLKKAKTTRKERPWLAMREDCRVRAVTTRRLDRKVGAARTVAGTPESSLGMAPLRPIGLESEPRLLPEPELELGLELVSTRWMGMKEQTMIRVVMVVMTTVMVMCTAMAPLAICVKGQAMPCSCSHFGGEHQQQGGRKGSSSGSSSSKWSTSWFDGRIEHIVPGSPGKALLSTHCDCSLTSRKIAIPRVAAELDKPVNIAWSNQKKRDCTYPRLV